jgi:hypothetical protein
LSDLLKEASRGEEADRVLKTGVMQDYFKQRKDAIIRAVVESPLGDKETHNRLAIALQVLNQLERSFENDIKTGKMAHIQLNGGFLQKIAGIA